MRNHSRDGHRDGHRAGDGAQDEAGGHGDQVEDGLVLEGQAVGELQGDVDDQHQAQPPLQGRTQRRCRPP